MLTRDASFIYNRLNGIVCIYKPPLLTTKGVRKILLSKLARDLNDMDCRPPRPHVSITGDTSKAVHVEVRPSYADHPLAVGPRYVPEEIKALCVRSLGGFMSGVLPVGINRGTRRAFYLKQCNPLCTFRITGQLGIQTNNKTSTGDTIFRCSSNYIKKYNIDKAAAVIEAIHKKSLFTLTGVHPQSQTAYDMIAEGLFRPVDPKYPMIYSIKCIDLNLPYFTLEVVGVNETENHLLNVVHEIGSRLTNAAITTSIQCIRFGYFTLEDALLKKHWTLQNVIDNMARCDKILKNNKHFSEFLQHIEKEERTELMEDVNDMSEDENSMESNVSV